MIVRVHFLPDDVTVDAEMGEAILDVKNRAGEDSHGSVEWVLSRLHHRIRGWRDYPRLYHRSTAT